uniref:Ig-like domain-containing protein n=1 Tax=Amphiprion ocellaris TaxID=80972 RepID=A0AAQ5YU75_AMPOC
MYFTCVHDQTCNRVVYSSRSICAAKGSSVDISCIYNSHEYHVESKFWFCPDRSHQRHHSQSEDIRGDSQYGGRAEVLEAERGSSTLRIRNLTDADSAQYHFKFTTRSFEWKSSLPGTALTVTATVTQLIVTTFKNGKIVRREDSSYEDRFNPGDVISCALKGHDDYGSPSVYVLNVPSVSVSLSAEIMEGSSVTLTCSSDADSAANHTWNKKNQTLVNKSQQLVFSSIQVSDSGDYSCTAENQLGRYRFTVHLTVSAQYVPIETQVSETGSCVSLNVTLTCSSDANPAATYTWYKENEDSPNASGQTFATTDFRAEHSGNYYCEAQNTRGRQKSTSHPVFVAGKLWLRETCQQSTGEKVQLVHTKTNRKQTNKQKTPNIAVVGKKHLSIFLFNLHICSDFIHPNSFTSPDFEKLNMSDQ